MSKKCKEICNFPAMPGNVLKCSAAVHDAVAAGRRTARRGTRRIQPGGRDGPAHRARVAATRAALRHGTSLPRC